MLVRLDQAAARRRVRHQQPHHAGERPDPGRPAGTDLLPKIEHIVVLMMENHSYDNYLGTLPRGDGFPMQNGAPVDPHGNRDANGDLVPPHHLGSTAQLDGVPTQAWNASHIQWDYGALDGFPRSIETTEPARAADAAVSMGYWTAADLPFYHDLAATFPLATRWFSSCLGPTFPNRRFLISGTALGLVDDSIAACFDYPPAGTIFDLLSAHGISWANYHNKPPGWTVAKSLLGRHGHQFGRRSLPYLAGLFPGLQRFVSGEFQFSADMYARGLLRTINHALSLRRFFADAEAGRLPAVSLVDPDYGAWSEEDPQDVQLGEGFAAAVINAVIRGPAWSRTLLIWLYDEHGGYYDHVPPPPAPAPDDVPATSVLERFPAIRHLPIFRSKIAELELRDVGPRDYTNYGFRVPAVIVSPFARPDCTTDVVYDHTSILKLIEAKWNLPALTRRDAQARAPLDCLDFDAEPAYLSPPALARPARPFDMSLLR